MLEPEIMKNLGSGGVALASLGTLIWTVRFVLTRVESAIKENTQVTRDLLSYLKRYGMYISGGEDGK